MDYFNRRAPVFLLVLSILTLIGGCGPVENPTPKPIQDLKMGAHSEDVIKKIANEGSYTQDTSVRRPTITWQLPSIRHFDNVEFRFTEKDRLFLIRFNLVDTRRDEYQKLKKAFFGSYDMSWEDPMRTRAKDNDVLLYAPNEENRDLFFLEFTNRKDGKKSIELFSSKISARDKAAYVREVKEKQEKREAKKTATPEQQNTSDKHESGKEEALEKQPSAELTNSGSIEEER